MATSKGTKRIAEAALDVNNWNTLERLILSQALFEFGVDNLAQVVALMSAHPMLHRPKNFFNVKSCSAVYEKLMEDASLALPEPVGSRQNSQLNSLATIHYQKRTMELKNDIDAEETKFKDIVREIDEIRAGLWDDRIRRALGTETDNAVMEEPIPADAEINSVDMDRPTDDIVLTMPPEGHEMQTEDHATPPLLEPTAQHDQVQVFDEGAVERSPQLPETIESSSKAVLAEEEEEEVTQEVEKVIDEPEAMDEDPVREVGEPQEVEEQEQEPSAEPPVAAALEEPEQQSQTQEEPSIPEQDLDIALSPDSETLRDAKRKASEAPSDAARDRKRLREDSEAMDEEEPGPSTGRGRKKVQSAPDKKFQNVINMLHSSISQHRYGNIFHNPIKKQDASDYHDIVKRPMDLKTIKQRVKEGVISNSLEFQRDVYLMFANAMIYNRPGSEIHAMAEEMMLESEMQINAFRQTEGFHRS